MKNNTFTILTFYQFRHLTKLDNLKASLEKFCSFNKLRGIILLAPEGINGTIAGLKEPTEFLRKKIISEGFDNLEIKFSYYKYMPFNHLRVKIKKEIITFSKNILDVENNTAIHIKPENWNKLIRKKNIVVLDVRNQFEFKMGTFSNSLNPKTKKFSEFKKFISKKLNPNQNKDIAMFCTGGIRCEKASSYMLKLGFKNLYQLKGGILKYLEKTPEKQSLWKGECFVFDKRVSVKNELKEGTYVLCHGCRIPLNKKDIKSKNYKKGICCPHCYNILSKQKIKKLIERNKQIEIAKRKGLYSPYIQQTPLNFL